MAEQTRITANSHLNFEYILRLLAAIDVIHPRDAHKYRTTQAIVLAVPIERVEAVLRRYLGSRDYPYTNFQLETREEWNNDNQVPQP